MRKCVFSVLKPGELFQLESEVKFWADSDVYEKINRSVARSRRSGDREHFNAVDVCRVVIQSVTGKVES